MTTPIRSAEPESTAGDRGGHTDARGAASDAGAATTSGGTGGGRAGRGRRVALIALGSIAAIGLWWLFTAIAGTGNPILAALQPDRVPGALWALIERGTLWTDLVASVRRLATGLVAAIVVGVVIGLVIGRSRAASLAASGPIQFLRVVSPLAWAPVAVALFGVGDAPVAFLVLAAAVWPIALSTASGVRAVDDDLMQVARTLGATEAERVRHIVLPSIRPHVETGIRQAIGVAWVVLVPAEMLGVSSGLGYQILNARDRFAYDEMLAVIVAIGAVGLVLDAGVRALLTSRRRR